MIVGGLIYVALYLTLLPLTGIVDVSELKRIGRIMAKIRVPKSLINLFMRYQHRLLAIRGHKNKK